MRVNQTNKLTEGALLLAVFAVILLMTLYIPVLGVVLNLFLALPFIIFSGKYDRKSSIVFLIGAIAISSIIGTVLSIPLALFYGLMGLILGDFIREKKSRLAGYITSSIVFLLSVVAQYAFSVVLLDINYLKELTTTMEESMNQSMRIFEAFGQSPDPLIMEQLQQSITMFQTLLPSILVLSSLFIVFIVQMVCFPIAKRFGVEAPTIRPFSEFQFPKSLLWYYLIALIISIIFQFEQGTYGHTAIINLVFILQFCMLIQGFSFIFYYAKMKGYPKFFPIFVVIFSFIFSIVLYLVRILGIIDLGFDLRKRLEKK